MRKLFLKLKRYFFKKRFGINPEDLKKLVYVQNCLDKFFRKDDSYIVSIKKEFSCQQDD